MNPKSLNSLDLSTSRMPIPVSFTCTSRKFFSSLRKRV